MKVKILVFIIFAITLLGCSGTEQLQKRRKLLSETEISKLNSILKEITDTLQIRIPSGYNHETYGYLPDDMKNRLQKALISQGFPIRADSAYALGIRQAINNIKNGKLIRKKYGLGIIVTLEDGSSWSADEVRSYILLNQYAISTDVIGGDEVNESLVAYYKGYESIFLPVLYGFYGFDVLEKAWDSVPEVIENEGKFHSNW